MRYVTEIWQQRPEPTVTDGIETWPDFYSAPVFVSYQSGTPAGHWETLSAIEQYQRRVAEKTDGRVFSAAPAAWKRAGGKPFHTFGGRLNDPTAAEDK